jgi:hypothetical protein
MTSGQCSTALRTLLGLVGRSSGNAVSRAEDEPERWQGYRPAMRVSRDMARFIGRRVAPS